MADFCGMQGGPKQNSFAFQALTYMVSCLRHRPRDSCLTQMGTSTESFIELTERIGCKTGGLSVSPSVMSKKGSEEPLAYVTVRLPHAHLHSADYSVVKG